MMKVAKLVNDNIVNDGLRGHHAFPVKREISTRRTGCPAIAKLTHISGLWAHSHLRRVVGHALGNSFLAASDVVVAECDPRGSDFALIDQIASQVEAAIL